MDIKYSRNIISQKKYLLVKNLKVIFFMPSLIIYLFCFISNIIFLL